MARFLLRSFASLATVVLVACTGPRVESEDLRYMVMFNGAGDPIEAPIGVTNWLSRYSTLSESLFRRRVADITNSIRASGKRRVALIIHGGLNSQDDTVERATSQYEDILADDVYPVFINWDSSLPSSYRDHILFTRRGETSLVAGPLTSAFFVVADLLRGIGALPIAIWTQGSEAFQASHIIDRSPRIAADSAWKQLQDDADDDTRLRMEPIGAVSDDDVDFGLASWVIGAPLKPLTIFFVNLAGANAWNEMLRRVDLLFQRVGDFEGSASYDRPKGLTYFMAKLADLQDELGSLQVDIIGHSMGSIVINRLLAGSIIQEVRHEEPAGEREVAAAASRNDSKLPAETPAFVRAGIPEFTNIVYLAAACSIRDYQLSAVPYCIRNEDSRVFHVVLHPNIELSESFSFDLAPRGSLLTWVDNFFATPVSIVERTAGRYENLARALYLTPVAIRDRVHVRVLDPGDPALPRTHGGFLGEADEVDGAARYRYWLPSAWFSPDVP
jgi:hypothetical protein